MQRELAICSSSVPDRVCIAHSLFPAPQQHLIICNLKAMAVLSSAPGGLRHWQPSMPASSSMPIHSIDTSTAKTGAEAYGSQAAPY